MALTAYPIGIQTFEVLRKKNYAYIDKTRLVYELAHDFKYTLLCRPPLFGKSLLLTTLKAYFEGEKELFEGLAISELEKTWVKHPVIVLDLSCGLFDSLENFHKHINCQLSRYEGLYGPKPNEQLLSDRFAGVIRRAYERKEGQAVILIDSYDKPLLDNIDNPALQKNLSEELGSLYGALKGGDQYIRFAMLTGRTKWGQLSGQSALNCFADINFYKKYASICGITQEELDFYFDERLHQMALRRGYSLESTKEELRTMYEGYRFTKAEINVYNPFSLLNALKCDELGYFWSDSQDTRQLIEILKNHHLDLSALEDSSADETRLSKIGYYDSSDLIPILYQMGYLTIKEYNQRRNRFYLDFPNKEVRKGFLEQIFPLYSKTSKNL